MKRLIIAAIIVICISLLVVPVSAKTIKLVQPTQTEALSAYTVYIDTYSGYADDEINNAISSLDAGTVQLAPIIYNIALPIYLKTNVNLVGHGYSTGIREVSGFNNKAIISNAQSNITVRGIRINGNKIQQANSANLMELVDSHNVYLGQIIVHDGTQDGISVIGGSNNTLDTIEAYNNKRDGVASWNPSKINMSLKIQNVYSHDNDRNGGGFVNSAGVIISNGEYNNNGGSGVHFNGGEKEIITGAYCAGNSAEGIDIFNTPRSVVNSNIATNNLIGITFDTYSDYGIATGNQAYNNGSDIVVFNSQHCIIETNQITGD